MRFQLRPRRLVLFLVLLPGFPLWLMAAAYGAAAMGQVMYLFSELVTAFNLYYALPARLFGRRLFPYEEFGVLPTPAGYAAAALLYTTLAVLLSLQRRRLGASDSTSL